MNAQVLSAVAAFALVGCAGATEGEKKDANDAWNACVLSKVNQFDDAKTDPVSLAYGIKPMCAAQFEQVVQTEIKGAVTPEAAAYGREIFERGQLELITSAILHHRNRQATESITRHLTPEREATYRAVTQAMEEKDGPKVIALLTPLAEQGDGMAQSNIALEYALGNGMPRNDLEAARWARRAAEQDDTEGQYMLGTLYAVGKGVSQNYVQAYFWLTLSAVKGEEQASKHLPEVIAKMNSEQLAEAEEMIRGWHPRHAKNCTNVNDALTKLASAKGYQYSSDCQK